MKYGNVMNRPIPRARKSLGQHFLCDPMVISQILGALDPQTDDRILEIGPGAGALSIPLQDYPIQLAVVELDPGLISTLASLLPNALLFQSDILKFDLDRLPWREDIRVLGNLPYNISTPLLFHLQGYRERIRDMLFMFQKEVADRIVAAPGNSVRGRLSVMCQTCYDMEYLFLVPPIAFHLPPKVDSVVLHFRPAPERIGRVKDWKLYTDVVRCAFAGRRKILRNALSSLCSEADLEQAGIDPGARAEVLSVDDYMLLVDMLIANVDALRGSR